MNQENQKPTQLDFKDLCVAMKEKHGLEPKDLLEAELFHHAALMASDPVKKCCARKAAVMPMLFAVAVKGGPTALELLEGEAALMSMPQQLSGLVATMCELGFMDKDRASKNWFLMDAYLDSVVGNDGLEKTLEELEAIIGGKPTGTAH